MIRILPIERSASGSTADPKPSPRSKPGWGSGRLAAIGLGAVLAFAVISWLIDAGRGEHRNANQIPSAGAVRTLAPAADVAGDASASAPIGAVAPSKVNHADCEPVIARFEERLRQLERDQCENLGTFQIAGRSTLFLLFRRMSDAGRRQLIDAELANLSAMPATDRDFIGKSLERLVDQYLTYPGALRIFSVTGPGNRDEPMEMSMWDIESESNFGRTDSGFPSWKSGPTGGWTAVIDSSLRARYGHLFAVEDEQG